jgi:hypothetical protein
LFSCSFLFSLSFRIFYIVWLSVLDCTHTGLPDFSLSKHTQTGKVYQMATNYTKRTYTYYIKRPKIIPKRP